MRRVATIVISGVLGAGVLTGPPVAAAPTGQASSVAVSGISGILAKRQGAPAKPSKACRKRLAKPRKVVPSKRFAKCVVKAMLAGRTAHLSSKFSDGTWNKGPGRFKKSHTEASARYHDGSRLVILKRQAWLKPAGHGWVKAKKSGSSIEQMAWNVQQLWVGLSSATAYRSYLRASSTGWKPTGRHQKVNGVKAREYVGTVTLGDLTHDDYRVWVDKWDRPVRIKSTLTAFGSTITGVQDLKKWGRTVSIKEPKMR